MIKRSLYFVLLTCLIAFSDASAIVDGGGNNTLLTSCPAGYVSVIEDYMTAVEGACPNGQISAGTAYSCLVSTPAGSCIMYAPTTVTYKNSSGSYTFTEPCAYE